jgi:hypothetical protein
MYLTLQERRILQLSATGSNQAPERTAAEIRAANPEAFHTNETLPERVFHHKPRGNVPYGGYLYD